VSGQEARSAASPRKTVIGVPRELVERSAARSRLREWYRTQHAPIWIGFRPIGFAAFVRLPNGGVHFGMKVTRDRISYGNTRETQYGIALWCRRNRKGQRGVPHALTFKVFAS
jgi:hypothetical protein